MKNLKIILLAVVFLWFGISGASGFTIELFEDALNIDGVISNSPLAEGTPGLGMVQVTVTAAGAHNVDLFVDHEIDEAINTYYNEYGSTNGAPGAVQSWEIDEPGYVFGDIYDNFEASTLDNSNGVPQAFPDDVSMALGWDFTLASGETALVKFVISEDIADMLGGITLTQTDPNSMASIFFSSSLKKDGDIKPIPEPTTLLLVGIGLVGLLGFGRRKFRKA